MLFPPTVTLLSCGEEECKGDETTKQARKGLQILHDDGQIKLLEHNAEGRHLFHGVADVIVCDGLPGNVAIKTAAGLGELIMSEIEKYVAAHPFSKIPMYFLKPMFRALKKKLEYSEFGGAPVLGVNGICIIGHGRSNAKAIASAIEVACKTVEQDLTRAISATMSASKHLPTEKQSVTVD